MLFTSPNASLSLLNYDCMFFNSAEFCIYYCLFIASYCTIGCYVTIFCYGTIVCYEAIVLVGITKGFSV